MPPKPKAREAEAWARAGRELALALQGGTEPVPVVTDLRLRRGEICVGTSEVQVFQWGSGDGEYVHKSGIYSDLVVGAIIGATHVIGNTARRWAARQAAAAQWRSWDGGLLYLTNRRLAIRGEVRWTDIWFDDIRVAEYTPGSIVLEVAGSPRFLLSLTNTDCWYVMFRKLADDEIYLPDLDPDVDAATAIAGSWADFSGTRRRLTLLPDRTFLLVPPEGPEWSGTYTVKGTRLILATGAARTVYTWSIDDGHLELTRPDRPTSVYRRAESTPAEVPPTTVNGYAGAAESALPQVIVGPWSSVEEPDRMIVFGVDGSYQEHDPEGFPISGSAIVSGSRLSLRERGYPPIEYEWGVDGEHLRLTTGDGQSVGYRRPASEDPE